MGIYYIKKLQGVKNMGTAFIVGSVIKIVAVCGFGVGVSSFIDAFHRYEFKFNKKGDKNATDHGKLLREKAKIIS